MIECDGGSFRLARAGANSVLLHNNGFVLVGGCGEEMEEGKEVYFDPGADDKVFRLDSEADRGLPRRGAEGHPDPGRRAAARAIQGGRAVLLRPRLRRRPSRRATRSS